MKILYIAQLIELQVGGAEKSTATLINKLRQRNIQCDILTGMNHDDIDLQEADQYDLIFTHLSWSGTAELIAQEYKKPLVYFFHSWEHICIQGHNGITAAECNHKCKHCLFRNKNFKPDLAVANSKYMQQLLSEEHGLNTMLLYPFIDFKQSKAPCREPIFITAPRIHFMKGTDRFIKMAEAMPDFKFRTVGYGKQPMFYPQNIIFCGQSDPKDFYKDTLIWIAPFRFESLGMMMIEAQMNLIPVIANNACAVKVDNIIKSGLTVDNPDDIDEWCTKIQKVHDHYDQFIDINAISEFETMFNNDEQVDELVTACKHLI